MAYYRELMINITSFSAPMGSSKSRKTTISDFCEDSLSQV